MDEDDQHSRSMDILLQRNSLEYMVSELEKAAIFLRDVASSERELMMPEAIFRSLSGIFVWVSLLSLKETETRPRTTGRATTTATIQSKRRRASSGSVLRLLARAYAQASTKKTRKRAKRAKNGAKSTVRSHYVRDLEFPKVKYKVETYKKPPLA